MASATVIANDSDQQNVTPGAEGAPSSPSRERLHDLDALRAIAMLLGLVLHGCMSFLPDIVGAWPVVDSRADGVFWWIMSAIHGFRMPLFFLISGFFTMMLWRKRGTRKLLAHRFKRVFVPFIIAVFTIIPSIVVVSGMVASAPPANNDPKAATADVDSGTVWLAAANGQVESINRWIELGVDVDQPTGDGSTPLAGAILFGNSDVVDRLLDAGADLNKVNQRGESAIQMLSASFDTTVFIGEMVSIDVTEDRLWEGRTRIAETASLIMGNDKPMTMLAVGKGEIEGDGQVMGGLMALLTDVPLLAHLWFLWFLCLLVIGFVIVVGIGALIGIHGLPNWWTTSWGSLLWALPITGLMQFLMPSQGSPFGPATSSEIVPRWTVVVYYAVFFAWGAMHFGSRKDNSPIGQHWKIGLPICVAVLLPLGVMLSEQTELMPRVAFVACQVSYAWLVSWGAMGLFRSIASGESKAMRYVSDSSYWVYLIHLPVIMYIQYLFRDLALSPWLKLPAIVAVCGVVCFATYHLFVRYTPIGTLLNGQRKRFA